MISLLLLSLISCTEDKHATLLPDGRTATDTFLISPIYGDSVLFAVNSMSTDKTEVKGILGQFHTSSKKVRETYFQRFVEKKGRFRRIHVVGTTLEHLKTAKNDTAYSTQFDQYVEFDELGIFNGELVDPISLIPLYPGRPMRIKEAWYPKVPVKIAMGTGVANFRFMIDSVYQNNGHVFARVNVAFQGKLAPVPSLHGAKVTINGDGWFNWNCTINQRRDTHLSAIYRAIKGNNEVKQSVGLTDSLIVYKEQLKF
jgi:hypothetical protein